MEQEQNPSTSTAGAVGGSSSKTWTCEGNVTFSEVTQKLLETYKLKWKTTLKQEPGKKYITSRRYVIDLESEHESHWRIELDPNFTDANGTRYFSTYVVLEKAVKPNAVIPAFFSIDLETGYVYSKCSGVVKFSAEKPAKGFTKYIPIHRLGKLADPKNTEQLSFVVTLQILKDDSQFQMNQWVDIEEVTEQEPAMDQGFDIEDDTEQEPEPAANYKNCCFESYYIRTANVEPEVTVDMADLFNVKGKLVKLIQFCHTGKVDLPKNFDGLLEMLNVAIKFRIEQLGKDCEDEFLKRLDLSNFLQIVQLVKDNALDPVVVNPVIWKFMKNNITALNAKEFVDAFPENKDYYEYLMSTYTNDSSDSDEDLYS